VVLKAGTWYLVASHAGANHAGAVRSYRVWRIQDLRVLPERFERPGEFDLADYWRGHLAEFDARRHVDHAVIRLSADAYDRLPSVREPAVVQAAQRTATPDGDGRLRVTIPVESLDQAVRELLKLGAGAEVLGPRRLRDAMAETIEALRGVYQRSG
jgi:predicted DNA-binding transcriptional regulator YafY